MKRKILLSLLLTPFVSTLIAQKTTAFAVTGTQRGNTNWSEVRLVDIATGQEVKTIYQKAQQIEILNARTGKAIARKDLSSAFAPSAARTIDKTMLKTTVDKSLLKNADLVELKQLELTKAHAGHPAELIRSNGDKITVVRSIRQPLDMNEPFATKSAAAAYDKKHERLYYTPMGINQLRYIDLKSKTPKIYYFEDDKFGALTSSHDAANQITRMVIASDGNGYALTNNGQHLFRFTTGRKPTITDLGPLSNDGVNAVPVENSINYGGDLVADTKKNIYLIGGNRKVYKINLEKRMATYLGSIKGLPKGFTTNGAAVEGGTKVIVSSSNSTEGYYRFDIKSLMASRVESSGPVFNASDLANANLLSYKEDKKEEEKPQEPEVVTQKAEEETAPAAASQENTVANNKISVYPNPVINGRVKLLFEDQFQGRYQVQFMDIAGRMIKTQAVAIENKWQVQEFTFPELNVKGNYLVRVIDTDNKVVFSQKLIVQ